MISHLCSTRHFSTVWQRTPFQATREFKLITMSTRKMSSEPVKCSATTRKGTRCTFRALAGSSLCTVHQRLDVKPASTPALKPAPKPAPAVKPASTPAVKPEPKPSSTLKTEDTGKIFEMAICLAYGIPYDGKYKYGLEEPEALKPRLSRLTELFPACTHTAKRGARYDFTTTDGTRHLSAKTTKGDCKVAPQCVGQANPNQFCERLGISPMPVPTLKFYIQKNVKTFLPNLLEFTFGPAGETNSDTIFYNKKKDTIRFITQIAPINWDDVELSWTCPHDRWTNSSTMKMKLPSGRHVSLLEFQFHTKSRTNMAVRWCFEELLSAFPSAFRIIDL
jgi:hypothetical protein